MKEKEEKLQEKEEQKEVLQDEPAKEEQPADDKLKYEKESYSDRTYLKVQKWRERGKLYGVEVPYLTCPLTKPEKPRKKYKAFAIVLFVLSGLIAAAAVALFVMTLIPLIAGYSGPTAPDWDVLHIVDGLAGMAIWLAIILLFGMLAALCGLSVAPLLLGIQCLHLVNANEEEIAYGPTLGKLIWVMIGVTTVFLVVPICLIILWPMFFLAIGFGVITYFVIAEKVKAIKWFKTLPAEQQKSYRDHARAIARVKWKKEARERTTANLFWR